MHAERPERILVRAHDAQVDAVAVDAEHVPELTAVDQVLHLEDAGVVEQQVARHQHAVLGDRQRDELVHLDRAHRGRLLDEDMLARFERLLREGVVRRHRGRDHDGIERVVREQVVEARRRSRVRMARCERAQMLLVEIAEPRQVREVVEVPDEVRAPVVEADDADAFHNFQTLPSTS